MPQVRKIINDPIHGVMVLDEDKETINILVKILDHEYFQRLRHIKQLGCGDLIFPGAVHTRFNHCIGACYIAKKFADKLKLDPESRKIAMVSALVHDIGHGPFSHAFEKIYGGEKKRIKHDKHWNKEFLKRIKIPFLNKKIIPYFLPNQEKGVSPLLNDMISSQLDVDRLDYLLRDGHFCGVPYGKVDLDWILSCITRVNVDGNEKIGITRKGLGAIENYLIARRLMTRNIYYHGKKNAAEYCVQKFLTYLMNDLIQDKPYIKSKFPELKKSDLGKFLISLYKHKTKFKKTNPKDEDIDRFIAKNFDYYSRLTDDDIWCIIKKVFYLVSNNESSHSLAKNLINRTLPRYFALSPSRITTARQIKEEFLATNKSLKEWQLYIDDLDFTSYKQEKEPIYIKDGEGSSATYADIFHESTLLNLLSGKKEFNHFLYVDQQAISKNKKIISTFLKQLNAKGCLIYPYLP